MKTIGIVAEYNPFHNGHKYQIEQTKKQLGADNVVVVMSGNFVQRGGVAWTDKYLRAKMAIDCGADLVFELPVVFSCASAETFALGSVALLDSLGFVDEICFGSEEGNLEILEKISSILNSNDYIKELEIYLKKGISFPVAREEYLKQHMPQYRDILPTLLKQPNNILGIEYIKALKRIGSHIKPVTIKRIDNGYHSTSLDSTPTLSDNTCNLIPNRNMQNTNKNVCCSPDSKKEIYLSDKENNKFSSASAIRTSFEKLNFFSDINKKEAALTTITTHVPEPVINILKNNKLQPTEIYKESQQTAKLEFFCDEFLKISQSRYGLSTSADSIANLLAFFTKASDAIDSIKTQKIDVHSYGFVPIRHFVEHVITYKNEFAADYEPYTLTFTRGENNEGILSVESKEGFISQ